MLKRVVSCVISLHLIFIVILLFTHSPTPTRRTHPLKVHDVQPHVVAVAAPVAAPIRKAAPPRQQAVAKPAPGKKKTAAPLPQPKKVETPPKLAEPQWAEIDQALAKIEQKVYPERIAVVPQMPAQKVAVVENGELLLIALLREALVLPERGEVRVELTVSSSGAIEKVVVLSSESEKNRHYLMGELPKLQLPLQGGKTWTVTFSNES